MPNQLFKKDIPISILFELFDQICEKKDNYYCVNQDAYKKMFFHSLHDNFCETIKEYYHSSFINIVRQICKYNNIGFTYYVKYCDYKYNIFYNVYF